MGEKYNELKCVSKLVGIPWAHSKHIYGNNISVAVLDTGISPHPDLVEGKNRIIAFQDILNNRKEMYDDAGHGTHVAGIIGGNGKLSNGEYIGVAPMCNIIGLKVLDRRGNGNISDVLSGFYWIIENKERYNIRIVNISVGTGSKEEVNEDSALVKGVNEVWDAGIIVVAAAGNGGPKPMSIGAPGISRKVITVGASDDNIPIEFSGSRSVDYSGRGPTLSCIKKPDIVAPGGNIISCNANRNYRQIQRNQTSAFFRASTNNQKSFYQNMYTIKSGTSMATPIVSGAIALLLSVYPEMSNREVKIRLKNTAKDLGLTHERQGWGLLDVESLLKT